MKSMVIVVLAVIVAVHATDYDFGAAKGLYQDGYGTGDTGGDSGAAKEFLSAPDEFDGQIEYESGDGVRDSDYAGNRNSHIGGLSLGVTGNDILGMDNQLDISHPPIRRERKAGVNLNF